MILFVIIYHRYRGSSVIKDDIKRKRLVQWITLVCFILLTFGFMVWYLTSTTRMLWQVLNLEAAVTFNKGVQYLLGCIIIGYGLVYAMGSEILRKGEVQKSPTKWLNIVFISGLLLIFVFPQAVHYPIQSYLLRHDYHICEKVSYRWLHSQVIIYTQSEKACKSL